MSTSSHLETCIKDENEILKNVENYNVEKIIDVCHPTHPKLSYERFDDMGYLPIHEVSVNDLKKTKNDENYGYIVKIGNKEDLELISKEEKNIVALRLASDHTFDSADEFMKLTNHRVYISLPDKFTTKFTDFLKDLIKKSPKFTVLVPISGNLVKLDKKLSQLLIVNSVFVLSETSENPNMALLIRVLPLKQIVLGFPYQAKFLKEDTDISKTLELIGEVVQYLAEVKEIDEELIIKATALNALEYLPTIKSIHKKLEALKEIKSNKQSETEKEFEYLSEIFETTSMSIIQKYEKEIESLKAKLQLSESLFNKISNFQIPEITTAIEIQPNHLPAQPIPKPKKWMNVVESVKVTKPTETTVLTNRVTQTTAIKPKENVKIGSTVKATLNQPSPNNSKIGAPQATSTPKPSPKPLPTPIQPNTFSQNNNILEPVVNNSQLPPGYKIDCNGRLHGPDGRFCVPPNGYTWTNKRLYKMVSSKIN
ncbi:hypothetical protein FO519_005634 [Halicephalobus sp. NKZ332]|nr:hypothetical protein FO519_005634 [Halicephalobus sp. NKZ332]